MGEGGYITLFSPSFTEYILRLRSSDKQNGRQRAITGHKLCVSFHYNSELHRPTCSRHFKSITVTNEHTISGADPENSLTGSQCD